jgi:hypothetical protein
MNPTQTRDQQGAEITSAINRVSKDVYRDARGRFAKASTPGARRSITPVYRDARGRFVSREIAYQFADAAQSSTDPAIKSAARAIRVDRMNAEAMERTADKAAGYPTWTEDEDEDGGGEVGDPAPSVTADDVEQMAAVLRETAAFVAENPTPSPRAAAVFKNSQLFRGHRLVIDTPKSKPQQRAERNARALGFTK